VTSLAFPNETAPFHILMQSDPSEVPRAEQPVLVCRRPCRCCDNGGASPARVAASPVVLIDTPDFDRGVLVWAAAFSGLAGAIAREGRRLERLLLPSPGTNAIPLSVGLRTRAHQLRVACASSTPGATLSIGWIH